LAHKNTDLGWVAASMIGYDKDGQELLDQELVIARAVSGNIEVCRIGHHRSDEDQFDYWGEPHAVISPSGTRVLFGSDWSGQEDGASVDSYVVELPAHTILISTKDKVADQGWHKLYPNPVKESLTIAFKNIDHREINVHIYSATGETILTESVKSNQLVLDTKELMPGIYFYQLSNPYSRSVYGKFIKH